MKLRIKITKKVLEVTKMCDIGEWKLLDSENTSPESNCAITYACRKLFPECNTTRDFIVLRDKNRIPLPETARDFIEVFDSSNPNQRVNLDPFEFEVDIPDKIIDSIGIGEVNRILSESITLEKA